MTRNRNYQTGKCTGTTNRSFNVAQIVPIHFLGEMSTNFVEKGRNRYGRSNRSKSLCNLFCRSRNGGSCLYGEITIPLHGMFFPAFPGGDMGMTTDNRICGLCNFRPIFVKMVYEKRSTLFICERCFELSLARPGNLKSNSQKQKILDRLRECR